MHGWKCQPAGKVRVCASFGWSKAVESLGPAARGRYDLTLRASPACAVDSCRDARENPPRFRVFRARVMNSHNADFITEHKEFSGLKTSEMAAAAVSAKVFLSPCLPGKFYQVYHDQWM